MEPRRERTLQNIIQYTYDALAGIDIPDGDFDELLRREVIRAMDWVEETVKTSLSPVRRTNLPKTPEEAYTDRERFRDFMKNPAYASFPTWAQLTSEQKVLYNNDPNLYVDGTLPWQLLTEEQRLLFASLIEYAPNKERDAERIDGKATAYIKLYRQPIIQVYYLALSFVSPPGYQDGGKQLWFRLYKPNEFLVYHREGAVHIFPAVMARITSTSNDPLYGSQYGVVAPRIPQVIEVDYEYGYIDPPPRLLQATAYRAAAEIIQHISSMYTAGLTGFGVEGFNASFSDGMLYKPLYENLKAQVYELLRPYYTISMTGW